MERLKRRVTLGPSTAAVVPRARKATVFLSIALLVGCTLAALLATSWRTRGARSPRRSEMIAAVLGASAAAGVFVELAGDVVQRQGIELDGSLAVALHRIDSPAADALMRAATWGGSAMPLLSLAVVVGVVAWRRGERAAAAFLGLEAVACEAVNAALKSIFGRPRPTLFEEIATLHSYAFPSGHTMGATVLGGAMAAVAGRLWPSRRPWLFASAVAFALAVGVSRVFLGVHWPTDVVAGLAAGMFLLLIGWIVLRAFEGRPDAPPVDPSRAA